MCRRTTAGRWSRRAGRTCRCTTRPPRSGFAGGASGPARRLVSDQVLRPLLAPLLSGRYAAGEKLPTQRALAADLGVTMTSLREALKRLEQMGLIEARQGDAMRVRDWREHGG